MSPLSRRCVVCAVPAGAALPLLVDTSAEAAGSKVIATSEVPVGGGVVVAKKGVVVTQPKAGKFRVFSATCTHQGCTVGSVADKKISCPCHGSQFAIGTGAVVAGPAQDPLPKRAFTVKDGSIHLT
jgi:Rieske Fe-S protein